MNGDLAFVWDEDLRFYDFGPGHPLSPIRTVLAYKLMQSFHLFDSPTTHIIEKVDLATDADLLRVHTPQYVDIVKTASLGTGERDLFRGLGTDDVPLFEGMHVAASRVVGASMAVAQAVASGAALHGVNIAGGLHHAMPDRASGFCIYNDVAIAISWLLDNGFERVGYVDVDVHHGDGVQEAFYNDPRVMTVSLHESGRTLFPGTGRADDIGGPLARGTAVNLALPAGTYDDGWLRAFDAVVPTVLRAFRPQIIVSQHGCDSHRSDPLAHLNLSVDGQRASYLRIHDLAHELCDGRWVAYGGGGYDWIRVVPRAWTHLTAIAAGTPIPVSADVPQDWQILVKAALGQDAPKTMGDGVTLAPRAWADGYDPLDRLDKAVLRVQEAVYPSLGLVADPYPF